MYIRGSHQAQDARGSVLRHPIAVPQLRRGGTYEVNNKKAPYVNTEMKPQLFVPAGCVFQTVR